MIIILWIVFSILVGLMGEKRSIGFGGALLLSLILSPLAGFIITACSGTKVVAVVKYKCKHCDYVMMQRCAYCERCMRDTDGFTVEQNKERYADPETVKQIREEEGTGSV